MEKMKKFAGILLSILLLSACTTYEDHLPNFNFIHKPRVWHLGIPAGPQQYPNPNYVTPVPYECVHTPYAYMTHGMICGYDCKISRGRVKCATFPNQRCLTTASSGYIACGFDCRRSVRGIIGCGVRFEDKCIETKAGNIVCGLNCRVVHGLVVCDESPEFRHGFPYEKV